MTFAAELLEDVETGPDNAADEGGDDAYISGMDSLNDDEHPDNLTYIDIAIKASANSWDRETEAKARNWRTSWNACLPLKKSPARSTRSTPAVAGRAEPAVACTSTIQLPNAGRPSPAE